MLGNNNLINPLFNETKAPLKSFRELEPLLFNKLDSSDAPRKQRLESRFWEPSGEGALPVEVTQGPWSVPPSREDVLLVTIPSILKDHVCLEELDAAFDVLEAKVESGDGGFGILEKTVGE